MPLSREQYNEITKVIAERRREALMAQKRVSEGIFAEIPAIKKYSEDIASLSQQEVGLRLRKDNKAADKLSHKRHKLQDKKTELLKSAGYPLDYLQVHYSCEKCKDTGFLGNEKCGCFKKLESELLNRDSGLPSIMERENFDTLDPNIYDKTVFLDKFTPKRITQYDYMTKTGGVIDLAKDYVRNFDKKGSHNLLMYGPAGTGKTFLTNCLARALIEKQHTVSYERAGDMFERMAKSKFSSKEDPDMDGNNRRVMESELLIIDDLGAEFTTDFSRSRLFSIITGRLANGKSTIISTNFSMDQIKDYYGERISSRLIGEYFLMPFYGADLRFSKRRLVS